MFGITNTNIIMLNVTFKIIRKFWVSILNSFAGRGNHEQS